MPAVLTVDDFAPYLDTRFQVVPLEEYYLDLIQINDHSNAQLTQFALTFHGIASPWLPQGLYKLAHPQMGELELFLVPNGPDGSVMLYTAAFSRFADVSGGEDELTVSATHSLTS